MRLKHQANIRAFGGNPDRVLLSGESAGGASVINHLARPNSRGLFAAAIQESGGYEFIQGEANASKFNADFKKVLDTTGCAKSTPADQVACLQGLSADKILGGPSAAQAGPWEAS